MGLATDSTRQQAVPRLGRMGDRARTRSAAALATALGVMLALAACTTPPPPAGSEPALAKLITRVERLPGVDTAEGEIRQVDAKDDPQNWITSLEVQADTTDLAVAERIRHTAARGVTGTTLSVTVDVPRGRASAPVAVDPMDPDVVDLAGRLRAEGLEVSGRAMGRDYWSSSTDADPATASIRGTVDGLSLSAESVCVP